MSEGPERNGPDPEPLSPGAHPSGGGSPQGTRPCPQMRAKVSLAYLPTGPNRHPHSLSGLPSATPHRHPKVSLPERTNCPLQDTQGTRLSPLGAPSTRRPLYSGPAPRPQHCDTAPTSVPKRPGPRAQKEELWPTPQSPRDGGAEVSRQHWAKSSQARRFLQVRPGGAQAGVFPLGSPRWSARPAAMRHWASPQGTPCGRAFLLHGKP